MRLSGARRVHAGSQSMCLLLSATVITTSFIPTIVFSFSRNGCWYRVNGRLKAVLKLHSMRGKLDLIEKSLPIKVKKPFWNKNCTIRSGFSDVKFFLLSQLACVSKFYRYIRDLTWSTIRIYKKKMTTFILKNG
jgi:hypothetical protein